MPSSVTSIDDKAFVYCGRLEELIIKTQAIPAGTFADCRKLKKVYFSKGLTTIYNSTFKNANSITDIYYEGTEEDREKVLIEANNGSLETAGVHYISTEILNVCKMEIHSKPTKLKYKLNTENLDLFLSLSQLR